MPRKVSARRLDVYTLHAHVDREPPDYVDLFRRLADLPAESRSIVDSDRLVALPHFDVEDDVASIIAVEGPVGVTPLIYNLERQTERAQPLQPGDVVVNRTHARINLESRRVLVEYNQRGAKAADIAATLQRSGRRIDAFKKLQLSLVPVIGEDFAEALDGFERIRTARVRLSRPNFDWDDWVDPLTDAAGDSDAAAANVEFSAPRNGSLSKTAGIVRFLKRATGRAGPSPIESASVSGRRAEDDADVTISSRGFVVQRRVTIPRAPDGQLRDADVFGALDVYEEDLRREGEDGAE